MVSKIMGLYIMSLLNMSRTFLLSFSLMAKLSVCRFRVVFVPRLLPGNAPLSGSCR
jgi:hypothetical protein